ncbi:Six-hairpin glycosidase-like protein [Cadophora sp. MPI-SDFR-AT-0126]|nr:Six-hairpin glycosidase-like protein [Leotiomycetes sp. MPI-SDFR-AT-0126]
MRISPVSLTVSLIVPIAQSKELWASLPSVWNGVIRTAYPVGNGRLGAMPFGVPGSEKVIFNVDSLWSGGPFEISTYNGGNPTAPIYGRLPAIRESIFSNGTGNVEGLLGSCDNYGTYQVFGNLSVAIDGVNASTNYKRSLDLENGIHTTFYTANNGNNYTTTVYCSFPDQVCVYDLSSSAALPQITIKLERQLGDQTLVNSTCSDQSVRLSGVTQIGPPLGMKFDGMARLITRTQTAYCSTKDVGALVVPAGSQIRQLSLGFGAGTNFDQKAGNEASGYSFKGPDPGPYVEKVTAAAASKTQLDLRGAHISDYKALSGAFKLEVPDTTGSANTETSVLVSKYSASGVGDPYLESLLFAFGRHLFISSSRANSLPPNLQGRWAENIYASWGADYHANINIQMNLWGADQTGLGGLQASVWNYMQDSWVPRGTDTARLLYDAPGWVTHNEMNIFGHTGMKCAAEWANYPASAAWMMQHIFDHYFYSLDQEWFEAQGFPLIKGVAQFWVHQLQEDKFFNDGTLVVNPCNSPEHGPTTFACMHYQQLIHQLFVSILMVRDLPSIANDTAFLISVEESLSKLDTGLHFSSFGTIKEWKFDDTDPRFPFDFKNDTHRHLSHLIGWYPGFSISGTVSGYTNATIQKAVKNSLINRGVGNGPDANAGWEKVWRGACWALLNETENAHYELRYAIDQNFANNGLSMYSGLSPPFQIDANFGLLGNILAMLVVDLPGLDSVVLGPAIPKSWSPGRVKGLRLRGARTVDFSWDAQGLVTGAHLSTQGTGVKITNKDGKVLIKA